MKNLTLELTLSERDNHLFEIDGQIEISAIGYNYINKFAEISILSPDNIQISDSKVNNPYIIYDKGGAISRAIYKCIAYGIGPNGNRVLSAATVDYNPDSILLKDLTYIVSNDYEAGKITKETLLSENERLSGYWLPLKDDLIIYCNLENSDINRAFSEYANNKAYADRIVQTIAKRNALKSHPALSNLLQDVEGIDGSRTAKIKVIKFFDNFDKDRILKFLEDEQINILEEDYIDLGPDIYISNVRSSNENQDNILNNDTNNDDIVQINMEYKNQLLDTLKLFDNKQRNNNFKKLFSNKYKSFSEMSTDDLELLLASF